MAVFAMGFTEVGNVFMRVLALNNWFEMIWVHTKAVLALVVNLVAARNRPDEVLVRPSVHVCVSIVNRHGPVADLNNNACPVPTSCLLVLRDAGQKSWKWVAEWLSSFRHVVDTPRTECKFANPNRYAAIPA